MAWQPIETAPKSDTPIQAKIPGHGSNNIIAWIDCLTDSEGNNCGAWAFMEDQEPPDCWTDGICWSVNKDNEQSIEPTHWRLLPTTTSTP